MLIDLMLSTEAKWKQLKVFSLPFLFRDDAHFWQVAEGPIGQELLDASIPYRLKGLCYFDAGSRSFYISKKRNRVVRHPDDLDPRQPVAVLHGQAGGHRRDQACARDRSKSGHPPTLLRSMGSHWRPVAASLLVTTQEGNPGADGPDWAVTPPPTPPMEGTRA